MNKESCDIPPAYDGKKYIINCAGDKVPVDDMGFTSRCAIGNTDDYLKSFKNHINSEIVSLGEPALISVVVPSYITPKHNLCQTLVSLCSQEYSVPAEVVVFINQPDNATKSVQIINDHNENFIRSMGTAESNNISPELLKTQKLLLAVLSKSKGRMTLRCVRQVVSGGLAGVYQTVTTSSIARVRAFCDTIMIKCDRQDKIKRIENYLQHSMLLFCDDDVEIKDTCAVAKAYEYAVKHDAVVLGRLYIKRVDTIEKYSGVLRDLMQLFFDFKYDHGLNFLTPRGMLLANILKVGGVKVGQIFADQIFFASAARGKNQYLVDANTTIGESDHPGNGNFLKKLRLYLEGDDNDAFDIFENVLQRYQEDRHKGKYSAADIERLILNLKTRDMRKISSVASALLIKMS